LLLGYRKGHLPSGQGRSSRLFKLNNKKREFKRALFILIQKK